MARTPQLVVAQDFVRDLTEKIDKASERIAFMMMVFIEDDSTKPVVDALVRAATRGVKVDIAIDTYTYTEFRDSYSPLTSRNKQVVAAKKLEEKLKEAGAHFTWLGKLTTIPFTGRTHIKWYIIDDYVYSFGGINLDPRNLDFTDYLFGVKNKDLSGRLSDEHKRIVSADRAGHAMRSSRFGDDDNMVLIDGGFLGDSIIYRRVKYWTERAEKVLYVSQYCPTGKLSRLLKRTQADLYFNHWTTAGFLNKLMIRFGMGMSKHQTSYHRRSYLHAKFIVFTLHDGSKVAITGSYNFMRASVLTGTREVALETTNKKIIKQLERFFNTHVR